jgi:hypothetical protein
VPTQQTILIHSAPGLWPMLEYELDIIQRELDKGNTVLFLSCQGERLFCNANNGKDGLKFKKRYCQECKSRVNNGLGWLNIDKGFFKICEYDILTNEQKQSIRDIINQLEFVKKEDEHIKRIINIDNIDIFSMVVSSLMTGHSDSEVNIVKYWAKFKEYAYIALTQYYLSINWLEAYSPDIIYIYNARTIFYRPLLRLAQKKELNVITYEYPMAGYKNYCLIENTYIHDSVNLSVLLRDKYDHSDLDDGLIIKEGSRWFEKKINKIDQGYASVFSNIQVSGKYPSELNEEKFILSFFISSESEIMSVEENYAGLPYTQKEAIKRISSKFKSILLFVRMHPALIRKDQLFVNSILELSSIDNVVIIPSDSKVDTYSLIEKSNLIVTFGSTVGVEAAFKKKPVISIGRHNLAQYFGCLKNTTKDSEIMHLIKSATEGDFSDFPDIQSRYNGACAFAWARMNFGVNSEYIGKTGRFSGGMIKNDIMTKISANMHIKIYNRLLDVPGKINSAFRIIINDPSKWKQFKKAPLESVKRKFFGELP